MSEYVPQLFTNVWSERSEHDNKLFEYFFLVAFQVEKFVHTNHECADRSVVRELFDVSRHFLNQFVESLQFFLRCRFVLYQILVRAAVEQRPEFTDKAVYTVDTIRIPRFGLFYRAEEHFVHTKCVRTVFLDNHIRVDNVEHGLAHLFNRPSADVFSVFENELCRLVFGTPCLECFQIQYVVGYDVYVYVDRSNFVLVFQVQ